MIPIKELPQKFLEKDGEVQWGRILWVLGVASLKNGWLKDGSLGLINSGNMLVSGSEVLIFFVVLSSSKRTSTNFGTGDEPLTAAFELPTGFFPPRKEAALKPTLEVGQDGDLRGRSGEEVIRWDFPSGP